jgi:hypothetical protein
MEIWARDYVIGIDSLPIPSVELIVLIVGISTLGYTAPY